MFRIKKQQFKKINKFDSAASAIKIKNFFKKLPRALAENAFLTSLVFFFIAVLLGGFLFYKYDILVERAKPESSEKLLYFDEKNFEAVLKVWQDREIRFQEADFKQYSNPFKITQ